MGWSHVCLSVRLHIHMSVCLLKLPSSPLFGLTYTVGDTRIPVIKLTPAYSDAVSLLLRLSLDHLQLPQPRPNDPIRSGTSPFLAVPPGSVPMLSKSCARPVKLRSQNLESFHTGRTVLPSMLPLCLDGTKASGVEDEGAECGTDSIVDFGCGTRLDMRWVLGGHRTWHRMCRS